MCYDLLVIQNNIDVWKSFISIDLRIKINEMTILYLLLIWNDFKNSYVNLQQMDFLFFDSFWAKWKMTDMKKNLRQDLCDNVEVDFLQIILHGNTSFLTIVFLISLNIVFIFRYERDICISLQVFWFVFFPPCIFLLFDFRELKMYTKHVDKI